MKATKNNEVSSQGKNSNVTVSAKYNQPHYLFVDLPDRYRSLMEFDIALIKEHYQQKENRKDAYVFLHEPYFE